MGTGSLKRIAALTAMATSGVMLAGVVDVPALAGLPATDPIAPTTTQLTVPSTSLTPETTVTTPTVTAPTTTAPTTTTPSSPTPSTPKVTTPKVTTPKVATPTVSTPKLSSPTSTSTGSTPLAGATGGGGKSAGGGGSASGSAGSTVQNVTGTVTSGGTTKLASGTTGAVTDAGTSAGGAVATAGGGGNAAAGLAALGTFGGPSAGGGGGSAGGSSGRAARLPATLSPAQASSLRFALEQLGGCLSAIAPLDREVLSMRAGAGGATPLSRSQVASRLGVSTRQVRRSEGRGLSGLRGAAERTGCAGSVAGSFAVSGIGPLTPFSPVAVPGGVAAAQPGGDGGAFVPARQAEVQPGGRTFGLGGASQSGPAWLVVLVTVLFSVAIAALMRELRSAVAPPRF